ncbi:hypothetical protein TNCV_5012311, partial [Trichonephila clavipes]
VNCVKAVKRETIPVRMILLTYLKRAKRPAPLAKESHKYGCSKQRRITTVIIAQTRRVRKSDYTYLKIVYIFSPLEKLNTPETPF